MRAGGISQKSSKIVLQGRQHGERGLQKRESADRSYVKVCVPEVMQLCVTRLSSSITRRSQPNIERVHGDSVEIASSTNAGERGVRCLGSNLASRAPGEAGFLSHTYASSHTEVFPCYAMLLLLPRRRFPSCCPPCLHHFRKLAPACCRDTTAPLLCCCLWGASCGTSMARSAAFQCLDGHFESAPFCL